MSLIVTSSSKDPTNITSQGVGIQSPFSYQNTFRSPLNIKPNSEVAVQSVRCNRQGYSFNHDAYLCIYWGKELPDNESITADHVTNQPLYVKIEAGSYTFEEFRDELQTSLSNTLKKAYPNIIGVTVTLDSDNTFFTFTLTQIGGHTSNVPADDKWIKVISDNTRDEDGNELLSDLVDSGAVSASGQEITASASDAYAINTTYPLSLCKGEFHVDPTNASNGGWKIGLTRNLYDPQSGNGTYTLNPRGFSPVNSDEGADGEDDFFDFVVSWTPGTDMKILHYICDEGNQGSMVQLSPKTPITNASLVAGAYDRIIFKFVNETITLSVRASAGGSLTEVIGQGTATGANKLFKPTGLTTQALYPKIFIKNKNDKVKIEEYDGINSVDNPFNFYENKLFGLPDSEQAGELVRECDFNKVFSLNEDAEFNPTYTRVGLNASDGQDYKYVLIFAENSIYDTILSGYLHKNLASSLGFKANVNKQSVISDASSTLLKTVLKSVQAPKQLGTGSLFIRVNNLPFNSLNGATEGISQILYACPRFDTNGNTTGGLYYEPAERVYVKLNNPDGYILSDISIDLVDINERIAEDLEGNTIVVLHIREGKHDH